MRNYIGKWEVKQKDLQNLASLVIFLKDLPFRPGGATPSFYIFDTFCLCKKVVLLNHWQKSFLVTFARMSIFTPLSQISIDMKKQRHF